MELAEPGNDDHYVKKQNLTSTHPEGHYGSSDTIDKLKRIVDQLYSNKKRKISVNDISLPEGGLFDCNATWAPPHHEHRMGNDADLNPSYSGRSCYEDADLRRAVEAISGGKKDFPYLQCEVNGQRVGEDNEDGYGEHIDFDDVGTPVR
jgi:hypothetical protein